ncbi:stress-activated map kinase-interacting protein 1 isoform X2 [Bacillus rossius redtenbacheri]|uniref:stress-activated map kinase-interacting protein 1 isoform X2 n=1 Tax=Bacillus rossius redtenbacheri TaxID=93214 RepID=UPI002FDD87BE
MALYDNRHWLLSHMSNSFISSDDTGICEMVILGEEIPRKFENQSKLDFYPGVDDSGDEDDAFDSLGQSFDIQTEFGAHRQRSNTAQRLEKMEQDRKRAAKVKHVKWEWSPALLTDDERAALFERKDFKKDGKEELKKVKMNSLLSEQLEKSPHLPQNPFLEYAKYDGNALVGVATRKYGIFLTVLPPEQRNYPIHVTVVATAKVQDLIGLVCWKCSLEHPDVKLEQGVERYGLYIAEDDGEVDWDFPCLEPRETVAKFGFGFLALVERTEKMLQNEKSDESYEIFNLVEETAPSEPAAKKAQMQDVDDLQRMKGHMTAMEAPLYQSYRINIVNKMRSKSEIHLGVSGEKVEIDPVVQQKVGARFWNKQRAVSYDVDSVAACDLTETRPGARATFRLVCRQSGGPGPGPAAAGFKQHDFEADRRTAEEIVRKVNHILELRSSGVRKEYTALRERKAHRRRSFPLGPR